MKNQDFLKNLRYYWKFKYFLTIWDIIENSVFSWKFSILLKIEDFLENSRFSWKFKNLLKINDFLCYVAKFLFIYDKKIPKYLNMNSWIYAYMNSCMPSRIHEFMNTWIHAWIHDIHEFMNSCMHEFMNSWIHVSWMNSCNSCMNSWTAWIHTWKHEIMNSCMNSWIHEEIHEFMHDIPVFIYMITKKNIPISLINL